MEGRTRRGRLNLSGDRRAALDLAERRAIQNDYRADARDPTDVELDICSDAERAVREQHT